MTVLARADVDARKRTCWERGATIIANETIAIDETEATARASLERRRGEPFAEDEWREAQANLLAFFRVLTEWQERAKE